MSRAPTISYRCSPEDGNPSPGHILMGEGPRVRRAYRVLTIRQVRPGWLRREGDQWLATWKLTVEPMSAERGRDEIAAGVPAWGIKWDSRSKRRNTTREPNPEES